MKRRGLQYFSLISVLLFACPSFGQDRRKIQRIRVGMTLRAAQFFPLIAAQNRGFYKEEGLDVELIVMPSTAAIQALLAGDLDFVTPFSSATRAAMSGMPIRIVMALNTASDHALVVRPEIRTMKELKSKTLAVGGLKNLVDIGTRQILKKNGLVPDVDVKIVVLTGASPTTIAALQAGTIDGGLLSLPYNKIAIKMGLREIAFLKDVSKVPTGGLATTITRMRKDPESIVGTIRATLKAVKFLKKNKDEFLGILAKESKIEDKTLAGLIYEQAAGLYSDTGIPSEVSMLEIVASTKETQVITRDVSIPDIADFSFAREAVKDSRN